MNWKNQWTRFWVAGLAVLLVGMVVFCLLHFSGGSVITGNLPREEWPKVQAAVRDWRLQKATKALRSGKWRQLPALLADCLGRPIVRSVAFSNHEIMVVTRGKEKDGRGNCYFLSKKGRNWTLEGEMSTGPSTVLSPQPSSLKASQAN